MATGRPPTGFDKDSYNKEYYQRHKRELQKVMREKYHTDSQYRESTLNRAKERLAKFAEERDRLIHGLEIATGEYVIKDGRYYFSTRYLAETLGLPKRKFSNSIARYAEESVRRGENLRYYTEDTCAKVLADLAKKEEKKINAAKRNF